MSGWSNSLGMVLCVILMGCSSPTPATPPPSTSTSQVDPQVLMNLGQFLPISAQAKVKKQTIGLEVAKTPEQQALGLMYRTNLPSDRGMLFPFNPPQPVRFWMKNTIIPLDMVFLRDGVVQSIAASVPPCTQEPCRTYGPDKFDTLIDQVIELRSGRASELGLKVGDRVDIQFVDSQRHRS